MPEMTIPQMLFIGIVAIGLLAVRDYQKCGEWRGCEINRQTSGGGDE
jgi:hypothetical protein